ncbi:MAG: MlaD family protein [Pseudonocardia sp.]
MLGYSKGRVAAVVAVAMVGATGAAGSLAAGPPQGRVIVAEFSDVSPIIAGQQVKVSGVTVGDVGEPVLDPVRKVAVVPLFLDASALPVHSDASASVAPISLLGERFINLDTGTDSAPELGHNDRIPVTATSRAEDLQAVLDTLDDPTAASLAAMLTGLGQGFDGNGEDIQKAISALAPSLRDTDELVRVLRDQNTLIGSVVDRVEPVATSVAGPDGESLDRLVASTNGLLGTTSARDEQLRATLAELPSTLDAAQRTLAELTGAARSASGTLSDTREVTDDLNDLADELNDFSAAAEPSLEALDELFDEADDLLDKARPIAAELRRGSGDLERTVEGAEPIVANLTDNLGNVFGFIRNWALTTNQKDGLSHYFRAHYATAGDEVTGFVPGGAPDLAPDTPFDNTPNEQIDEPVAKSQADPSPSHANVGSPGAPAPSLLDGGPNPDDSATGLTPEQEQGGVGFLLGGN